MSWINENGVPIETPRMDGPPDAIQVLRATVIFWNDLKRAGVPLRSIAACFDVSPSVVCDYLNQMPEEIREDHVSEEYLGRLRAAFAEGGRPKFGPDVRRVVKGVIASQMRGRPSLPPLQR